LFSHINLALVTFGISDGQVNVKNRVINLENQRFSYIGKLSFGLYVYHPLIIILLSHYLDFRIFELSVLNAIVIFASVFLHH